MREVARDEIIAVVVAIVDYARNECAGQSAFGEGSPHWLSRTIHQKRGTRTLLQIWISAVKQSNSVKFFGTFQLS